MARLLAARFIQRRQLDNQPRLNRRQSQGFFVFSDGGRRIVSR
jgi:hypothetical protein